MPRRTMVAVTPGNLDDRLLGRCQRASGAFVIAGRAAKAARVDPAIHLLREESMRNRWTPGSRPGVTNVDSAKNIPKRRGGNYIEVISIRTESVHVRPENARARYGRAQAPGPDRQGAVPHRARRGRDRH